MSDVISAELLAHLVCPETRQSLALAGAEELESFRNRQGRGALNNRGGKKVSGAIDGALIREDGAVAYLIIDGIPDLLVAESVDVDSVGS